MAPGRRQARNERWRQRAERVHDEFGVVLLLLALTYVLASLAANKGWAALALTITTCATAIVALTSSHAPRPLVVRSLRVAAVAVALALLSAATGGRPWLNLASLLVVGLLAVAMGAVLRRVLAAHEVSFTTILGAISVYASLGILFTWAYAAIDRLEGGGFFGSGIDAHGNDFLFFSYTTLTTTGYGNLVPAGEVGRMLAGVEMMLGQIFLVTLVAGLVSLWRPGERLRGR